MLKPATFIKLNKKKINKKLHCVICEHFSKMRISLTLALFHVVLMLSCLPYVSMDIFRSVIKLKLLAQLETRLIERLGNYLRTLDNDDAHRQEIKRFYDYAFQQNQKTIAPHYLENPINTYHFVKHMHRGWQHVIDVINCNDCLMTSAQKEFVDTFDEDVGHVLGNPSAILGPVRSYMPSQVDYQGVVMSLVRLWKTYHLDLTSLYSGKILDTQTDPLDLAEVLDICRQLDNVADYYKEIKWLEELKYYARNNADDKSEVTYLKVVRELASAYSKFEMPFVSKKLIEKELQRDPDNDQLQRDLRYYEDKVRDLSEAGLSKKLLPMEETTTRKQYEALCRGDIQRPVSVTSRLICRYRTTVIPIWRVKEEVMNWDPPVSLFYEIISDNEQDYLKNIVISMLQSSTTMEKLESNILSYKIIRVSETAWIRDEDPVVRQINKKVDFTTGLSTLLYGTDEESDAEAMQVLNYGIGGMYEPHVDFFGDAVDIQTPGFNCHQMATWKTNRLATWMFYLNGVKSGGATVFTHLNITVPVTKGAAVFWYSFKRNGQLDHRTEHAGCPVLLGSKWVANKWIRNQGQTFRERCGTDFDAKHPLYEKTLW